MKRFFLAALSVLVLWAVVAWWIRPRPIQDGKTVLTWCSDDNPARRGQIVEILGGPGHEHYKVRWDEAHESIVFPADGVNIIRTTGR